MAIKRRLQWREDSQGRWSAEVIANGYLVMLLRVSHPHPDGRMFAFVGRGAKLSEQYEREWFADVESAKRWAEAKAYDILRGAGALFDDNTIVNRRVVVAMGDQEGFEGTVREISAFYGLCLVVADDGRENPVYVPLDGIEVDDG